MLMNNHVRIYLPVNPSYAAVLHCRTVCSASGNRCPQWVRKMSGGRRRHEEDIAAGRKFNRAVDLIFGHKKRNKAVYFIIPPVLKYLSFDLNIPKVSLKFLTFSINYFGFL